LGRGGYRSVASLRNLFAGFLRVILLTRFLRPGRIIVIFSTAGNIVGGVLFVGLPFTYLNPREREEQMPEVFLREAPPTPSVVRNPAP
jgi:hypothetical protein